MDNQSGIKNPLLGTPHSYARAFGSRARAHTEADLPALAYLGAMSDKADKVINELTTFLSEKEREELNQVIGYLNTQKRKLSHNDPERIRLNFLQDFLELIARTGVKFHDDTNAPYLQGTKEGLAEVLGWLKQKRQRGF